MTSNKKPCAGFLEGQPKGIRVNQGLRGLGVCLEWSIAADLQWSVSHQEFFLPVKPSAPSMKSAKSASSRTPDLVRTIKKYPNRRLYDTHTSSYITLHEVKNMVVAGTALQVVDAKNNEDLTRSIFLQIILEEESGGVPMFSEIALANIIRFYGHSMQGFMGSYLEKNVQAFLDIQQHISEQSKQLTPELWTQMMSQPNPFLKNVMGNYTEQSQQMLKQMQDQMFQAMGLKR